MSSNRRRRRSLSQQGFTLLELLISITLLGMILVLLFGGLRLGVRSWDAVQHQVDNLNTVRSVENFLRHEMEMARPYRWKGALQKRLAFLGDRNQVNFIAQLPDRFGTGGLYAVKLEIDRSSGGKRLIWKHLPLSSQMQDFSALSLAQEMVLVGPELSGVEDIWLTYYGRESDSAAPRWTEQWESDAGLPLLIRIQVKFANGAEWPDFVVAPMLTPEPVR
jgi:general secretion pathway protein J